MSSLIRRVSLTLLAAGLSVSVFASANAQEAEEPTVGDSQVVELTEPAVEEPPTEVVAPTSDVQPVAETQPVADIQPVAETQPVAEVVPPTAVPTLAPTLAPLPTPTPVPAPASGKVAVSVVDNRFQPRALTVAPGTTVTWTNNGINIHTLTSSDAGFDSGGLVGGASYSFTFDKAGTYNLICRQHGLNGMAAQVIVQ
jgi:plastocyanin